MNLVKCAAGAAGILLACIGCTTKSVTMSWQQDVTGEGSSPKYSFTIKNLPKGGDWEIYFSMLPCWTEDDPQSPVEVSNVHANVYKIAPKEDFDGRSSVVATYFSAPAGRYAMAPENPYIRIAGGKPQKVELSRFIPLPDDGEEVYAKNAAVVLPTPGIFDVIPSVKKIETTDNKTVTLGNGLRLSGDDLFGVKDYAASELERIGMAATDGGLELRFIMDDGCPEEGYVIDGDSNSVTVKASGEKGAFYGIVTLSHILENAKSTKMDEIPAFRITDWPDLGYRGYMLDVARNFTTKENVLRFIDELARFKVNGLQFHIVDDEGWRLEIEGLPELTGLGAHHSWNPDEGLMPSYDGNWIADNDMSSNGFYTRADFIEILKFAKSRNVQVIPEIDVPGHSRAAIKAMQAYEKRTGDESFRLDDPEDASVYSSAQWYRDNVICVARESAYTFLEKIVAELCGMFAEAGVEMPMLHIGGDEVAEGCWAGSPICQKFLKDNGMKDVHELKTYFVKRMVEICGKHNLKVCGWQEMPANVSRSYDSELQKHFGYTNCWNTVPEWGDDYICYTLANLGYPIALSNVTNNYLDLCYDRHPEERGHQWGGTVTASKSYALQPFDIYRSARSKVDDSPADIWSNSIGKPALEKPENIFGVSVQLWAETVRSFDDITSYSFPKALGAFERGWNTRPDWLAGLPEFNGKGKPSEEYIAEEEKAFEQSRDRFLGRIAGTCPARWDALGLAFHIERPGLKLIDGQLRANSTLPGGEIRYTTDGSTPTRQSALWTAPVEVKGEKVLAKVFYGNSESATTLLQIKK